MFLRRFSSAFVIKPRIVSYFNGYCSFVSPLMNEKNGQYGECHSPCEIKVVDSNTWRVSSSLVHMSKGIDYESELKRSSFEVACDEFVDNPKELKDDHEFDLDEIEDMRMYGSLFYKIDRSSMEFEEYNFDFHKGKSSSKGKIRENPSEEKVDVIRNNEGRKIKKKMSLKDETFMNKAKPRTPTFNQLTGPYHEPFCLDVYVSKGSVRACVVHRASSKVVVVAHSISKDMKYDLGGSVKSKTAADAVGKALAQRALGDDIHNVIFTPRKGDKMEGKLLIVVQSIIDNGVYVKVKLKQRNPRKHFGKPSRS